MRVLGALDVRVDGVRVAPFESARAESLLAYLLLHRDAPQPRQRLSFLLWPDSTEAQARTNLRHVLHRLRRALPDADRFLDVTPRTLQWRPDAPFRLDLAAFEDALARAAAQGGDAAVDALREAVEAYAGDLLEGSYDEWLLEERDRLRDRYAAALERLCGLLESTGRHAEAIGYAERLVEHDPLREETYRLLMRLHEARGDRARALRAYHACAAALRRDLGIEPSAETSAVYERLVPGAPAPGGEPEPGRLGDPGLVGRAAELRMLTGLWRDASRGRAHLVLVTGEAGVGKSRLAEELRAWCAQRGATTAASRAYQAEGALAYGPVVAWLRSPPLAAGVRTLDQRRARDVARLLPELTTAAPASPALSESEERRRLFDALATALVAPGTPLLLVADDVQWADRETLQFLHFLVRSVPDAPLLVVATARREDVDRAHPFAELATGLGALGRLTELELGRLSPQETAVLGGRLAGRAFDEEVAARLYRETEGNPLFVVEALRAGWSGAAGDAAAISPRVQSVIESRLARLSAPAAHLVGVAATIGREFTTDVLALAGEADDATLVMGLDELWRRRIVREQGPVAYDFTHDKIREVAYLRLEPGRRRRTHLRVARALETIHAADPAPVAGQLALHHDRAGRAAAAVDWYARAADAAQALHADAETVRLLGRALELVPALPDDPGRTARELALVTALLAPLSTVEGYASRRLIELQERGVELTRTLGAEPDPALLRSMALAALSSGDFDESRRLGRELRARGARDADDVLLVEGVYVLGVSAFWHGELHAARRHFSTAVDRYRPEHRATHLARYGLDPRVVCLSRLANTLWLLGDDEAATRAREEALAMAHEAGHPSTTATALVFAALLAAELGDRDGVARHLEALEASAREHDVKVLGVNVELFGGYVDVLDGCHAAGIARIRRAAEESRTARHAPGMHAVVMRLLLAAHALARDPRAGLEAADVALASDPGVRVFEAETLRLRACFRAALGVPRGEVDADLDAALAVARRQGARALERRIAASRASFARGTPPGTLGERPGVHAAPRR